MTSTWSRCYNVTKRFSSFAGQWPYQTKKERVLRTSMIIFAALVMNVPQVCKFIHCNGNLKCIIGTLPSYLLVVIIMFKVYMCQYKNSKIKILIDLVVDDWKNLQSPEEHEIMKTYAAITRWIVLMYSTTCLLCVSIFVMMAVIPQILDKILPLNESRPIVLPYEAYYFVDERKYFFYIFSQGILASIITMIGLVAYDTMFMTFVEHVCGTFAVAGFRFEHLICENSDIMGIVNNNLDEMYNKRMAYCLNMHWSALNFAEYIESIFTISFGVELLFETVGISITLFQITLQSNDTVEASRYIIYVVAQLVHLFVFCWEGQRLADHSLQIREKIYSCNWYKIPIKSQKLILHVMIRTLRPSILSGNKIFVFSLLGFSTILQTSMSYFTVLSSV